MRKDPAEKKGVLALGKQVGERIRKARRLRRMSTRQLATLLELPVESIEDYESGRRLPRTYTVSEISRTLGVSAGYLLDPEISERKTDRFRVLLARFEGLEDEKGRDLVFEFMSALVSALERMDQMKTTKQK